MPLPRAAGCLFALCSLLVSGASASAQGEPTVARMVSLNPSLTEMLVALGASSVLVGVDEYSARIEPQVHALPTVGGLFNPSLEAVVALEPELVVLVPGAQQRDLAARLRALGVAVLELPNLTLEQVLESLEALGARVGRGVAARARVFEIRRALREVAQATAARPRLRTALVIQRDPLYVVGRGSFIDEMLRAAGGENVAGVFSEPYPRAATEWLIAAAPEVILDATDDPDEPRLYWSRWPSLPAVAGGRVLAIPPDVMRPGPYLDRALRLIARAIHGPEVLPGPEPGVVKP
jgi:iron complex transport system substrate-binding protein